MKFHLLVVYRTRHFLKDVKPKNLVNIINAKLLKNCSKISIQYPLARQLSQIKKKDMIDLKLFHMNHLLNRSNTKSHHGN